MDTSLNSLLKAALPTGRPEAAVLKLLADVGITLDWGSRSYRPRISLEAVEVKRLKPRTVAEMLAAGLRDFGFTGADWAFEAGDQVIELCDTGLDKVRIVAAGPSAIADRPCSLKTPPLRVASEYRRLTMEWASRSGRLISFIESRGTTEVFPPEDADVIVDAVSTGETLAANNLREFDEVYCSSTRLFASVAALNDPAKRPRLEDLSVMIKAACDARLRVMVELNSPAEKVDQILRILPAMRSPTISRLSVPEWFGIKTSVPRTDLPKLIPLIRRAGGVDLIVSQPYMVVP